jgi:hypothetical protein
MPEMPEMIFVPIPHDRPVMKFVRKASSKALVS